MTKLYQCTNGTKLINLAVKENIDKFLEDFYFELTLMEYENILRFQFGTSKIGKGEEDIYPIID